jgi:hypothetical protein
MSSIVQQVRRSVARQSSDVVLRRDMLRFGSSARVDAALSSMVASGKLARVGVGIYAKTVLLKDGRRVVGVDAWSVFFEALKKLDLDYEVHPVISQWLDGQTEQVPVRLIVRTQKRVSRKMSVGPSSLYYVSNFRAGSPTNPPISG